MFKTSLVIFLLEKRGGGECRNFDITLEVITCKRDEGRWGGQKHEFWRGVIIECFLGLWKIYPPILTLSKV